MTSTKFVREARDQPVVCAVCATVVVLQTMLHQGKLSYSPVVVAHLRSSNGPSDKRLPQQAKTNRNPYVYGIP